MYPANRPRSSDMSIPEDRLLRHVPGLPIPLQRHVRPGGPATATCEPPADPASATCASRRTRYCDMCLPQDPLLRHVIRQPTPLQRHVPPQDGLLRHVPGQPNPAPATCDPRRTCYCDMYPANRPRSSDMCLPEDLLLRHVTRQPIPPQRHVPPAESATATCTRPTDPGPATCSSRTTRYCDMYPAADPAPATCAPRRTRDCACTRPADPAPATCASRRSRYCDMYPARRSRSSDMCVPEEPLLRHVPGLPSPLQRHVRPGGPATATCTPPTDPAPATCAPRRTGYCDM